MESPRDQRINLNPLSLINEDYNPQLFYAFIILLILDIISMIYLITAFYKLDLLFISYFFAFSILTFFLGGGTYTEYKARFDYLTLTANSIKYQNSPKIMHPGWLSKKDEILYNNIKSIKIVQIKSGLDILDEKLKQAQFNPEGFFKKNLLLEVELKNGKIIRIGERLPSTGLFQLSVIIEGRAQLGNIYAKLQEKFPNFTSFASDTINMVKQMFKKK